VVIGATTVAEMIEMAEWADGSAAWDSVWVGDSIFAKPRLDAIALLGALAARTQHVRLGPACFASTPLRNALILAYQWASLDLMSGGRTIFVACQGQPSRRRCLRQGVRGPRHRARQSDALDGRGDWIMC
jgi:alkanesulfonate monooxygenase SsuD/methylene tetrahydromethanopterin reductase-like flavin-dependent oxidoreductase (luciferase family)